MTIQRNRLIPLLTFTLFSLASSCDSAEEQQVKQTKRDSISRKPSQQEVRDAHGCITSDGYVWSAAKDSCIRLWESGAELLATNKSELVVFAVESNDKTKAEIFIPGDSTLLLLGQGNGTYTNDSLSLLSNGNNYVLRQSGKAIYQTAPVAPVEEPKPAKRKKRRK